MTITADYNPAPGEDPERLGPNEFTAGSELTLNCLVQGHSGDLKYTWSVAGNPYHPQCLSCDIDISSTMSTLIVDVPSRTLLSYHAGIYTCTVSENGKPGQAISDNFTVTVVGGYAFQV